MLPIPVPPWPIVGSVAGGIGAVWLAWTIRRYRGKPGVNWFFGVFAAQALWCLSYGVGLLVTDRALRIVLDAAMWIGVVWTGIAFLGFALEYTGRADVIRSRLFAAIVGFGLLSTALAVTNPAHGALWTGLRLEPTFGVTTIAYAFGPWAYLVVGVATILVASAVFLLVDTLLSYGPLYRAETAAVALSSIPPGFALVAWILELGPVPELQLAPIMFVPHVILDAYAFDRAEMFERYPTTSRAAERTAIDDLADPIVALAPDRRVVRLNPAAETALGVDATTARNRPISAFIDVTMPGEEGDDEAGSDGESNDEGSTDEESSDEKPADDGNEGRNDQITLGTGVDRRTYAVSISPLTEPRGTHVGYTLVLSDVTERERRRQQLEVLNRILRHNLRNDAGVVHGYGELLAERLDDPELHRMADAIERRAGALAALGQKAGTVETLLSDVEPLPVDVAAVVAEIAAETRDRHPDATVGLRVDVTDATLALRADALQALVENTVENALEHHDGAGVERDDGGPWIRLELARTSDAMTVVVEDDGPGIPDHEIAAVESGTETSLEHGSGIGLWIVEWASAALGADVAYEDRDPRGTKVTVRIPILPEG